MPYYAKYMTVTTSHEGGLTIVRELYERIEQTALRRDSNISSGRRKWSAI